MIRLKSKNLSDQIVPPVFVRLLLFSRLLASLSKFVIAINDILNACQFGAQVGCLELLQLLYLQIRLPNHDGKDHLNENEDNSERS